VHGPRHALRELECNGLFSSVTLRYYLRAVISQDSYQVAFDLSQKSFQWWFPAFGLIFLGVGAVMIWLGRRNHWPLSRRFVSYFMVVFACLWSGFAFSTMFSEYLSLRSEYRKGQFSVVEGRVTNFHPMPYEGHQDECFSVQAETFCYSDYAITGGFNNAASHGGPIREGLPVRVSYIGNTIVRLEVRSDALPSGAERKAVIFAVQKDWKQRQERDPKLDRLNLGFSVAVVFMTVWWNLQPLRFIRLWLKPPHKPITVTLFRLFFAANLIGAISYFVGQVTRHQRTFSDYRAAAEIAAAWIAVMWVMVTVALWSAHRQDHPRIS
jgi:hypothetical protein